MTSNNQFSILIVGVGGQGVLLASELISYTAISAGLDVKKSEVHGMSQRGGTVLSHVRIGPKVYSPTIEYGQADFLLSFEQAEGLRSLDWMKSDGLAIVSTTQLIPAIVTASKTFTYPRNAIEQMKKKAKNVIAVEADRLAAELGNPRLVNTILLGILSRYLPFSAEQWNETIKAKMKAKLVDINLNAFRRGREIQSSTPMPKQH
jgi:indolepyruvate ferredoxin oxidoreductase beta subunit